MSLQRIRALRGPNIWDRSPVLEAWLDLEERTGLPPRGFRGFEDRIRTWLPLLDPYQSGSRNRGAFLERLSQEVSMAEVLAHLVMELQALDDTEVGAAWSTGDGRSSGLPDRSTLPRRGIRRGLRGCGPHVVPGGARWPAVRRRGRGIAAPRTDGAFSVRHLRQGRFRGGAFATDSRNPPVPEARQASGHPGTGRHEYGPSSAG